MDRYLHCVGCLEKPDLWYRTAEIELTKSLRKKCIRGLAGREQAREPQRALNYSSSAQKFIYWSIDGQNERHNERQGWLVDTMVRAEVFIIVMALLHHFFSLMMNNVQSVLLPNESNLLWSAYTIIRGSEFLSPLNCSMSSLTDLGSL